MISQNKYLRVMMQAYYKAGKELIGLGRGNTQRLSSAFDFWFRHYGSDHSEEHPEFINSTIMVEDGLNVRELPLVVRKVRDVTQEHIPTVPSASSSDSSKYNLIQAEFRQCSDLRDIFSLLSKCIKITPNIALGAIERICEVEKEFNMPMDVDTRLMNAHLAKGAILEKLLKVVMQTEDTQTLLNALNVDFAMLEPFKYNFCDELLLRVIDNKLTIGQLADFVMFLVNNKKDSKYEETIDKLWVGFAEKQDDINEKNFVQLLNIACNLKASKSTVMVLLEKKLWSFWWKLSLTDMQEIVNVFNQENNLSQQSFSIVGRWLNTNIHILDEDSLLDFITKLTRLQYTDLQIESAVERYLKARGDRIESQVLIVGILNYCMTFRIRNKNILNKCGKYFILNGKTISHSFLKSFIYPFGFLYHSPENMERFWQTVEHAVEDKFTKMTCDDLLTIFLSGLYLGQHPTKFIDMIFNHNFLYKISQSDNAEKLHRKLKLIDTAMSLECETYTSSVFSKVDFRPVAQDIRLKKLIKEIQATVESVANGDYKVSTSVSFPNLCDDRSYVIDFLLHPESLDTYNFNWITKSEKNQTIAILIHVPEHYCYGSNQLIGPQIMRKKHLRLLGMRVISLNYSLVCKLQSNKIYLERYIKNCLENSEMFL